MLRDGGEADRGIGRRSAPAACHAEREEAVVGVVVGGATGLEVRRDRGPRRPCSVEQQGVEIRRPSDAAQEQGGDEECQDSCGRGAAHEP